MNQRPSVILDVGVRVLLPLLITFSIYLLFVGHNAPGGGFTAGLVAGASFALPYLQSGPDGIRRLLKVEPTVLLGVGIAVAALTAVAGLAGGELLTSGSFQWTVPVLGKVKTTSALVFDVGVFLVVVGLVTAALMSLGPDTRAEGSP